MKIIRLFILTLLFIPVSILHAQDEQWLQAEEPVVGAIEEPGDRDLWLYDGTGNTTIQLLTIPNGNLIPRISVEFPDNQTTTGRGLLEIRLPISGTYRIEVSGQSGTTGPYELVVLTNSPPPTEDTLPSPAHPTSTLVLPTSTPLGTPPPTFIPAASPPGRPIRLGETVTGTLRNRRWDTWTFEAEAGQHITIHLRSSDFDPLLELYGDADLPLYTDDDSGRGRDATLYNIVLNESGTYRILARSFDNEGAGTYYLSLEPNGGTVPSIEATPRIHYDQLMVGQLRSHESIYYLNGSAGDRLNLLLSSDDFDPYLELQDSEGYILQENDDNGRNRNAAIVNFELPCDGIYFITVAAYSVEGQGTFELELLRMRDQSPGGEIAIGQRVTERLLPGSVAVWTFEGNAEQTVSMAAMPSPPERSFNLVFEVLTPTGERLVDDNSGVGNTPALIDLFLETDGIYTIRLREAENTIGGTYLLTLAEGRTYFSPGGQPSRAMMMDDSPVQDSLSSGQDHLWIVNNPENKPLSLRLETGNETNGTPLDFTIQITDTDWVSLDTEQRGDWTFTTETTHDYLVLIEYNGRGTQTYRLALQTEPSAQGTLTIGQTVQDVLPAGDRHIWQFAAPSAGVYCITMTTDDPNFDPYLLVSDQDGATLVENDDGAGDLNPRINLTLEANQLITITAASFGDLSGGAYELLIVEREP